MPIDHSADLMKALVAKLYMTVTGNDESIKMPRNKFVSWLMPGLPFDPVDFRYCARGFNGATAEEITENYHQAFVLSKLCDLIPEVSKQFIDSNMQQTIFTSTQDSISSVYKDVLNYSRVLNNELSDTEKEKLQKFRNALTVTREEEDILTGEKKTVTVPGPLTVAYTAKMSEYLDAVDEFMNLKIDAMSATGNDPEAKRRVHAWANKAVYLRKKMDAAEMAWVSQGYRNEYESINAYIDQVTRKSMVLYKQDLIRKFNAALMNSASDGDFYYTTMLPGNFAASTGWTRFNFYTGDYETHYNKNVSKWSAGGGVHFGLFSIGGGASGSKVEIAENRKASNFNATLEFTQVPICRPWFEPGFFWMRAWTLDKIWDLNFSNKQVSNGAEEPVGRLVAYPVSALFVRNVRLQFAEWDSDSQYIEKNVKGGGAVSYGPFHAGGSYSHGNVKKDAKWHTEGGAVVIPGMQLIGFVNNIIPKSPNPNPEIKPEQFVGGE